MAVETVTLMGDAVSGIHADGIRYAAAVAALPVEVKLGRRRPPAFRRANAVRLQDYVNLDRLDLPASVDWYTKAAESIARMYLNDRYGDCVFAGKAHALGIWSANDPDSGGLVLATDKEISDQYFAYTGGADNGAVISDVLDLMKSPGFLAGGKRYTIDGYVSVDWTSKELTQAGLALFGAGSIGINLPSAWTSAAVWDVTSTGVVGGHDVTPCGYGAQTVVATTRDGVLVSSWGRLYLITWYAWTSRKWLDELYFMVPTYLWTGADKTAPSGFDYTALKADLAMIGKGTVPPTDPPTPTPPPPGPTPTPPPGPAPGPAGSFHLAISADCTPPHAMAATYTITPRPPVPKELAGLGAPLWVLVLIQLVGTKVIPLVIADLQAGKSWAEIGMDILVSLWTREPYHGLILTLDPARETTP